MNLDAQFLYVAVFNAMNASNRFPGTPQWNGELLRGKTILVYWHLMGWGDAIQFARHVRHIRALSEADVILEVPQPLVRLFANGLGARVVGFGDPLPHFDAHVSLRGYGFNRLAFGPAHGDPGRVFCPYLFPPTPVARPAGGIGIRWAGESTNPFAANRHVPFAMIRPLIASAPDLRWVCLQVDEAANECDLPIERIAPGDWADTAQTVANLDLVISVDSSIAHLAGAMNVPTWLLLPSNRDVRWADTDGRDRTDLYPSMRVYHQAAWQAWAPIIEQLKHDLQRWERRSDAC